MTGSREMWERQQQYAEMDNGPQEEEMASHYDTRRFCSGCQTNWAALPEADEEGDESYAFCPLCRTDEHLEDGREGHAYLFNPISGAAINTLTRIAKLFEYPAPPPVKPLANAFDEGKYHADKEDREQREDRQIEQYLKAL